MKKNNTPLITLWIFAGLALLCGFLLSVRTLTGSKRISEIWTKKANDIRDMQALRSVAAEQRQILQQYAQFPAAPTQLEEIARTAVPGLNLVIRSTDKSPSVPGWTARKVSLNLADVSGDDLGRFLAAASSATPPWALLNCTLSASPTRGRLAKAELILVTVERN
jgi:hypothetical protein